MPARGNYETAQQGWSGRGSILAACSGCGVEVRIYPGRAARKPYCSRPCYLASLTGAQNPNFKAVNATRTCVGCGAQFIRYGAVSAKNPLKYCSRACHYTARKTHDSPVARRRAASRQRDLAERANTPPGEHHTEEQWLALLAKHAGRCVTCGTDKNITRDHIVPVSKGGSDCIENIQPMCKPCNCRKGNRL